MQGNNVSIDGDPAYRNYNLIYILNIFENDIK